MPYVPHQVDHRSTDHPKRQDHTFVTAWADAFLLDADGLNAARVRVGRNSDVQMTTRDVQAIGLTLADEALADGSCIHPGTLRLSRLVGTSQAVAHDALRVLRGTGWIGIQHRPTKTSPTVHRLTYPAKAAAQ